MIITSDLLWNDHVNGRLRSILVYEHLFSFILCPSIYRVSLSGSKQGHYQSFSPVCLDEAGIPTIISYREDICVNVFNTAHGNRDNKLNNKLLTEASEAPYSLRSHRHFAFPKWETDRFKNTFILSSCLKYN